MGIVGPFEKCMCAHEMWDYSFFLTKSVGKFVWKNVFSDMLGVDGSQTREFEQFGTSEVLVIFPFHGE